MRRYASERRCTAVVIAVVLADIVGCHEKASSAPPPAALVPAGPPASASAAPASHGSSARALPFEAFQLKLEMPSLPGKTAIVPPESVLGPFRVWINQETPRQKKTPEWRSFPAKDGLLLDTAPDGKWRCLINPVQILGKFNEDGELSVWRISRALRCSNDGWNTYVEEQVHGDYLPDGKRIPTESEAVMYLNDVVDEQPRSTVVVLQLENKSRPKR